MNKVEHEKLVKGAHEETDDLKKKLLTCQQCNTDLQSEISQANARFAQMQEECKIRIDELESKLLNESSKCKRDMDGKGKCGIFNT